MKSPDSDGANNQLDVVQDKLAHYSCLTLAHLLALISQPTTNLIASDVSLVVINCLSALVNSSLPKAHGSKASSKFTKGMSLLEHLLSPLARRQLNRFFSVGLV